MLKKDLIQIGYEKPELRPHLRKIIASEEFNQLFGDLRSLLNRKRDLSTYKQVLRTVVEMDALNRAKTEREVVPYVHRALDLFPDKVRTIGPITLFNIDKPVSKYKAEFAKVYNARSLPFSSLKTQDLARKVLLDTKANQRIIAMVLDNVPITNAEALYVANNFAPEVAQLSLTNRDMPPGTLRNLKVIPSYLFIEGNPRITMDEINEFRAKHPNVYIRHDNPEEGSMSIDDIYDEFTEGLTGMFDARTSVDIGSDGEPIVSGFFGRDAPVGREGTYVVRMMPISAGDTNVSFEVTAEGRGYQHNSVEVFGMPKQDLQSEDYMGNRHINGIVHQIQRLLYDVMVGNRS